MDTQRQYLSSPNDVPPHSTAWFVWLMCGFALTIVAALIYGFVSMMAGGAPQLDGNAPEAPTRPAGPASPAPRAPGAIEL